VVRTPAIVMLVLLAATALAFVRTQQQKLERSPVGRLQIDRIFSPGCDCETDSARIAIRLRRRDTVRLELVNADGEPVRTLARSRTYGPGDGVWEWDGLGDDGRLVPDGVYRPQLTLASAARTLLMPNRIVVDTRAPAVTSFAVEPGRISPDGDRRLERATVRYAVDEAAHALLYVNGELYERTRLRRTEGTRVWPASKDVPAGRYALSLAGEDRAGNVGPTTPAHVVTVRYVELARSTIRVRVRARFGVRVLADARSVAWRFARATGTVRPGLLVLRAPRRAGRYTLFVSANGHADRATVVVSPRPRAAPRPSAGR
jgi:hypothetical protein